MRQNILKWYENFEIQPISSVVIGGMRMETPKRTFVYTIKSKSDLKKILISLAIPT